MDASPFGTLSGELRNRIYAYFFHSQLATEIHLDIRDPHGARLKGPRSKTRSALALTATCRLLRHETLALFWSTVSIQILALTLTAYSFPATNSAGDDHLVQAILTNVERAATLDSWLATSGILSFAPLLRPISLNLGTYNPRITVSPGDAIATLTFIAGGTAQLTKPLLPLHPNPCSLRFQVQIAPSTALGPIVVPNERGRALRALEALCAGRMAGVQALFDEGFLTTRGLAVLAGDLGVCRAVAEMLVKWIVPAEEEGEGKGEGGKRSAC